MLLRLVSVVVERGGIRLTALKADFQARRSPGSRRSIRLESRSWTVSDVPNPAQVMSLKRKGDFLMHGVVLQNRVFRTAAAMFHVKHRCVKAAPPPVRCFT